MSETMTTTDASAAAIFAQLPPIFRECVDSEFIRFDFSLPRVAGDHVYATDGTIAVRVLATPERVVALAIPPLATDKRFPSKSMPGLFVGDWEGSPTALPDLHTAPVCDECHGRRRLPERECDKCHGDGEVACLRCGQDAPCGECGGKGKFPVGPCVDCGGVGIANAARVGVEVGRGISLSWRFVEMLTRHGASGVFLPVDPGRPRRYNPLRFTLPDDVEGIVMPMSSY